MENLKKKKEKEIKEVTSSASAGAYSTPFNLSKKEMDNLEDMKKTKEDMKKTKEDIVQLTEEDITKIVKKLVIKEEVYGIKPSEIKPESIDNKVSNAKAKDIGTKNAKKQKVYNSDAAKATETSTNKTGKEATKATNTSLKKVADSEAKNLKDKEVPDANEGKKQNEQQRIEAQQGGMQDLSYDYITPSQQKSNTESIEQGGEVGEQLIDDAKKRKENKAARKVPKVYGSDVEFSKNETNVVKPLAFENRYIKSFSRKKPFFNEKEMLSKIPEKCKEDGYIFEMRDPNTKYRVRWDGTKNIGIGVVLECSNVNQEKALMENFIQRSNYGFNRKPDIDKKVNLSVYDKMFKQARNNAPKK